MLVTEMTDPDWEPVMKRASAIVTNRGGRTCHAAIIARELGIPAVVGCGDATQGPERRRTGYRFLRRRRHRARLRRPARSRDGRDDTRRDAAVPDQDHDERRQSRARIRVPPTARTKASGSRGSNSSSPRTSASIPRRCSSCPARPADLRRQIEERIAGYASPTEFYVSKIAEGVATIAAAFSSEEGHRPAVRLQVERVFEPARRRSLRAARGEPDAGIPRRLALHRVGVLRLLRARVPRDEARARRHGPHQRRGHGAVRAHAVRSGQGHRVARAQRARARPQRAARHHDVRTTVQCHPCRRASSSTSTVSRSARTT